MAEDNRSDHGAGEVTRADEPDLRRAEMHHVGPRQHGANRAHQRHLKSVQDPGYPERQYQQRMKPAPWETVEARGNQGLEGFGGQVLGDGHVLRGLSPSLRSLRRNAWAIPFNLS